MAAFRGCRLAALVTILAAIAFEIVAITIGGRAPHTVVLAAAASPVGMTAFTIFVILATAEERTLVFRLILIVASAVFAILYVFGMSPFQAALTAGASITATIFGYLLYRIAHTRGAERAVTVDLLAATTIIGTSALSMVFFLDLSTKFFNPIFDAKYIRIDELFGAQPSATVAALFTTVRPIMWLCLAVYFMLPVAQAIIAALEARHPQSVRGLGVLPCFIITAMLGYVLYALMPAIGPIQYLGSDFPMLHIGKDYLATRPTTDLDPSHIRGAMPSLHITWAALLYLSSRRLHQYVRATTAAFLFFTFLATLGLIVALPLILLVQALAAVDLRWRTPERALGAVAGILLLAIWVILTRLDFDVEAAGALLFVVIAATITLPLYLGWLLDRAMSGNTASDLVSAAA